MVDPAEVLAGKWSRSCKGHFETLINLKTFFTSQKSFPELWKMLYQELLRSIFLILSFYILCQCACTYVGQTSQQLRERIKQHLHAFSGKRRMFCQQPKKSLLVYDFKCCCGQAYVGRTILCLSERIKKNVPDQLFQEKPDLKKSHSEPAMTKHLKESPGCISKDTRSRFKIPASARSESNLNVL